MNKNLVQVSKLCLYTDKPFMEHGADLRRALTAQFKDIPLLHNHLEGGFDYRSPRVRYIVNRKLPQLVAFGPGLEIIENIYHRGTKFYIGNKKYIITGTELENRIVRFGVDNTLHTYSSSTLWIALNEKNYDKFQRAGASGEKKKLLSSILTGNYLSLCKTLGIVVSEQILTSVQQYKIIQIRHSDTKFFGVKVVYVSNMLLDNLIGIGKLVSKGFGLMRKID